MTRLAIALFRAVRRAKHGLEGVVRILGKMFGPIGRFLIRGILLRAYRIGMVIKMKAQRVVLPAQGVALFFVSNRYLLHAVLGLAVIATVIMNFESRQAHAQDVGQNSLLYALATHSSDVEIVNVSARPEVSVKNSNYLGSNTLVAIPHVDFDYQDEPQSVVSLSVPGTITAPSVMPAEVPTETTPVPAVPRNKVETYVVQDGDTIASIAHHFSVNVGTILWSNNLTEREYIRPGDSLKIPPVSGILVTVKKGDTLASIADRYNGDVTEIQGVNQLSVTSKLTVGRELIIPGGSPSAAGQTMIAAVVQQRAPSAQPDETLQEGDGGSGSSNGSSVATNVPKPSDANTKDLPSAKLLWPTSGHVITQYYGWKHTGVDIDGDFTSPLYAAYDGVVEKAGWNNGGYGLMILIKHLNGMETRYGHSSKLFVQAGDVVKKGQVIAMMGSTGRSTGSHLHFEVYVNGKRVNPLGYIR